MKAIIDLIRRVLIALGWVRDVGIKEAGRKEVHDAVVKTGKKHGDRRKSADADRVRDDDEDLFRD